MVYGAVMMDSFKGNQPDDEPSKNSTGGATDFSTTTMTPSPRPVIEVATYADTDVYECYIRGFESRIVMRRTQDDWVNITQVFKIAQFSKTQRTKVLEKESNDMRHEKVQGGYGRFQGTWIPLEDAKYMVTKYNIRDPVVTTILAFQLNPNNPPMKRSKNSVLKRTSPDGRIASPSSYNKTPKKNKVGGSTTRKTKKNNMLLHANPSPLQNLVFQTPQQSHMPSQLATNAATTVSATSQGNQLSNTKGNTVPHINTEETPLALGYSATQKPLQFYPVPTSLNHPHKSRDFAQSGNESFDASADIDKANSQSFLTFIPEGPNTGVFSSSAHQQQSQQRVPSILVNGNGSFKKASGKRKKTLKTDENSIEMVSHDDDALGGAPPPPPIPGATPGSSMSAGKQLKHKLKGRTGLTAKRANNAQDKAQQNFKMMQKQLMWQNIRQQHKNTPNIAVPFKMSGNQPNSNNSSMDMFSTGENPTPMSSRSSTPNTFAGLPTAPATAHGNEHADTIGPPALSVEEYKEMILQVLSSEDGCDKDYQLPPQLYHPPLNFDVNFEIDDQGHTPLHWAAAMANVPLIKLLIALNANALQCNLRGFNCITKSAFYNNCYKANTFSEMVSILRICLITPDSNGRLPLHYLVELSVNKSKDPVVINFYMDTIIHNLGQEDYTLLRMCLNFQDSMGNTVLHLAALNLNLELCNKLCYLGSSMDITNCDNETPASILAKFNLVPPTNTNTHSQLYRSAPTPQGFSTAINHVGPVGTTPRPTSHPSLLSGENSNRDGHSHKLQHEVMSSIEENEKHQNQVKLTPSVNSKKTDVRNFLPGSDSTSLSNLMDDLSNMNSFVTSSVVRDIKTTPSKLLECSPIMRKKKPTTVVTSSNLKKSALPEAIQSPLVPVIASPGPDSNEKEMSSVAKLASKLGKISNALKVSINAQVSSVTREIESASEGINCIKQNVFNITRHEKDLLLQFNDGQGVESVEQMEAGRNQMREYVHDGRQMFVQCLEKSQALNLATLVQEEESRVDPDPGSSPSKEGSNDISLKLAAELALLQFKRRLRIQRVTDARTKIDSNNKISKYRRLIGMTIENIDTKLDDIEVYLKTNS
ncbi:SWI4 (YER111C) [Zygosaccharomyces parabailii]|uniref:ZYBA0S08-02850g1_1 n=1 Tax=Zygosaccharomyces bailii (strain CLIB 213 / ATCC 58445 / CBS 680 / BCRC 21525 / NBRC 1098 / NCYC 1416 / NRRL Y-2227) TaxID=1333698 RepID=A0A8J2T8L2_ZYGB2|nr:SWI4 (YER111C) [Zygosaccharomyces parabailii]CDF90781.1 ZYBA0S08-02850g1_1 [Zygosaccharomyces bailii CLIB 213]